MVQMLNMVNSVLRYHKARPSRPIVWGNGFRPLTSGPCLNRLQKVTLGRSVWKHSKTLSRNSLRVELVDTKKSSSIPQVRTLFQGVTYVSLTRRSAYVFWQPRFASPRQKVFQPPYHVMDGEHRIESSGAGCRRCRGHVTALWLWKFVVETRLFVFTFAATMLIWGVVTYLGWLLIKMSKWLSSCGLGRPLNGHPRWAHLAASHQISGLW